MFQVEMLYQRYFLRMNQSNMTHVLGLLAGLAFALGLLLVIKLILTDNELFFTLLQRTENLFLAITLVICIVVYAGINIHNAIVINFIVHYYRHYCYIIIAVALTIPIIIIFVTNTAANKFKRIYSCTHIYFNLSHHVYTYMYRL